MIFEIIQIAGVMVCIVMVFVSGYFIGCRVGMMAERERINAPLPRPKS
jgi:hypothetical protein